MEIKKSLNTIFIFIISVFVVTGLSYISTVYGAKPSSMASDNNAPIPLNEGGTTQPRCSPTNQGKNIGINSSTNKYDIKNFYDDCNDKSVLITEGGLFIKTPKTSFVIYGNPSSSSSKYKNGGLFVGCSTDSSINPSIRQLCGEEIHSPKAYLYGDVTMYGLNDQNSAEDRRVCIDANGLLKPCP